MRLLVTGGAGFIGSNFIRLLINEFPEYSIINLDKLTYAGNPENLRDIESAKDAKGKSRYQFIKGDICDGKAVDSALAMSEKVFGGPVDAIVNFAAESHVDRSIAEPADFVKTDVLGTYTLLEAVKAHKIGRYIQISTDEVYGSLETGSADETYPIKTNSPYSASKAGGDLLVYSYFKTYGLPVIITRSSNNFGPYQFPEKLIPLFITNALTGKKLPLYGDGLNVRNWIYVEDNCRALEVALRKGELGQIYNIGGAVEKTNVDITGRILAALGLGKEWIQPVNDRLGHDRRYSLSSAKVMKLGWKVGEDFDARLNETIEWYKNNKKWWEKLLDRAKIAVK